MPQVLPCYPQARYVPREPWQYVMVGTEASRLILKRIVSGERAGTTLAVWEAVRLSCSWETGVLNATVQELADMAGTVPNEVYRALSRLVEIGALWRLERGRYTLKP